MGIHQEGNDSECNCPVEEYINGEDDIPICIHYDDDREDRFFAEVGTSQANSEYLAQDDHEEEEWFDLGPPPQKITKFQDAISSLEAVQSFLDSKGYAEEVTKIASSVNELTHLHCATFTLLDRAPLKIFNRN